MAWEHPFFEEWDLNEMKSLLKEVQKHIDCLLEYNGDLSYEEQVCFLNILGDMGLKYQQIREIIERNNEDYEV